MRSSKELTTIFFKDLKAFNSSNFKTLVNADLSVNSAVTHKAFSSVLTRYFIFREKHPEITDEENKILYFKLKLDLVAQYFSEYPDTNTDRLVAFQIELRNFVNENRDYIEESKKDQKIEQVVAV